MRAVVKAGVHITLEDVLNHHRVMRLLSEDKPFAVLADAGSDFTITSEAKSRSAELTARHIAMAIVTSNPLTRLIANIYISFNKPKCPTKLFMQEDEAMEWLKEKIRVYPTKDR